jgi:hypothetical protein
MIFLANFLFMTGQEQVEEADRRHGEFNMLIEAGDKETALLAFRDRLEAYRAESDFFYGVTKIFLIQLLEFDGLPQTAAMLVNLKSVAGDPVMPYIGCSIPTQETDACRIFQWQQNRPEVDGMAEQVFLEFQEED